MTISNLAHRSKAWSSHFKLLKSFVHEQRCFLPDPYGNVHLGRMFIPPNILLICSIEMLSNVYSQSLMNDLLLKEALQFEPLRVFKTAKKLMHIYSEWRTGNVAWKMQVSGHLSI